VNTFYIHPADFGVPKAAPAELLGGEATDNAAIARRILRGEPGAPREIVRVNAAASLLIAGRVATIAEGIERAAQAIDGGEAARVLEQLVAVSNAGREAATS
jgi:anthranilate phosphoribosyltransferase